MSGMIPLRAVAICSNVLFATFGGLARDYPVLGLHLVLLPVNGVRLLQALSRRSKREATSISIFIEEAVPGGLKAKARRRIVPLLPDRE